MYQGKYDLLSIFSKEIKITWRYLWLVLTAFSPTLPYSYVWFTVLKRRDRITILTEKCYISVLARLGHRWKKNCLSRPQTVTFLHVTIPVQEIPLKRVVSCIPFYGTKFPIIKLVIMKISTLHSQETKSTSTGDSIISCINIIYIKFHKIYLAEQSN